MDKPNDVSAKAWEFAVGWSEGRWYEGRLAPRTQEALARAFDAATEELRRYSVAAAGELQFIIKDEECDHTVGLCWCDSRARLAEYASTLAAYTSEKA